MVEGYMVDETIGFVTEYLQDFRHVRQRIWDADEEEGVYGEALEGAALLEICHFATVVCNWFSVACDTCNCKFA